METVTIPQAPVGWHWVALFEHPEWSLGEWSQVTRSVQVPHAVDGYPSFVGRVTRGPFADLRMSLPEAQDWYRSRPLVCFADIAEDEIGIRVAPTGGRRWGRRAWRDTVLDGLSVQADWRRGRDGMELVGVVAFAVGEGSRIER